MIQRFPNEDPDQNQARTSEPVPEKLWDPMRQLSGNKLTSRKNGKKIWQQG